MAEQIPIGVATSLVSTIASSAFREIGRIFGVMDDLENLKDTLEAIKVVLSDAELNQGQDAIVAHWVQRFKKVLYDADDLLDDLFIKDLRHKKMIQVRAFFSRSVNPIIFRAKLARKIKNIRKDLNIVAQDMSMLNLNRCHKQYRQGVPSTSSVSMDNILGREENKSDIVNLLKQSHPNQNISLVVVVGMPGLGKTALAQLVYNAAKDEKLFDKYLWVSVSEDFQVKTILKRMLESLKKDAGGQTSEAIQQTLREELSGQKYMLVLDNVWNEDQLKWSSLMKHLTCGGQGSKILVTTRSTLVSRAMGINEPYVLQGLTHEKSWELLRRVTFEGMCFRPELEKMGEEIAKKCEGLPLAIRIIGGFLKSRVHNIDHWSSLLNGGIWRLCEQEKNFMPVLNWCYRNLPLELRQCFAYCCLYPKGSIIQKDELIQMWMAQGYLGETGRGYDDLRDVGYEYVHILLMRSFFHDASMDENGAMKSFKIHDLMHDLAMHVAGNDCYLDTHAKGIVGRPMHVSLFGAGTDCSLEAFGACKLRTIIIRGEATNFVAKPSFIKKLKYPRVLCLLSSPLTKLPKSIDKAKHLRYLDLSHCQELSSLPESVGNLVCLQTLKLNHCQGLVTLPESIGNLVCLQTLNLEGCSNLIFPTKVITKLINLKELHFEDCKAFEDGMPVGLGKLISLQTLTRFVAGNSEKNTSGKLNELKELDNLRGKLSISNLGLVKDTASESHETNLTSKKCIKDFYLYWGPFSYSAEYEMKNTDSLVLLDNLRPHQLLRTLHVDGFPGVRFSDWITSLTCIVRISLFDLPHCKHLPPLETLACLRMLEIRNTGSLEWMDYENTDVFFPSLEQLSFFDCEKLRGWERLGDDKTENHLSLPPFRSLFSLQISNCPNLTCMPTFPHLVEKLELERCSVKLMSETSMAKHESSSISPLSALRTLRLWQVTEIEAMPEDLMKNLTSLHSLELAGFSTLQILQRYLHYLPSQLQDLKISFDDDKLDLWKQTQDGDPPHALSSLQNIDFRNCGNLKALPEQIGELQSLRHIQITNCPNLESLDEAERCLTNIQTLLISDCPLLARRYNSESGEDQPKIAHISNLHIS